MPGQPNESFVQPKDFERRKDSPRQLDLLIRSKVGYTLRGLKPVSAAFPFLAFSNFIQAFSLHMAVPPPEVLGVNDFAHGLVLEFAF